jgi:hypothetical protein
VTPVLPYLSSQFERARPILFTGAGFSVAAKNVLGERVSTPEDLRKKIWEISFPGELLDANSSLQHLFELATLRKKKELKDLLTSSLSKT